MSPSHDLPSRRCTRRQLLAALGAALVGVPAHAARIADQEFAERIRLAGVELQLNGVGVRAVAWFTGYAAGLYLREAARTEEAALAQAGPKRLQMKMLVDVEPKEFVKAIDKGMKRNLPPATHEAMLPRIEQFDRAVHALGMVRRGDVVDLDLLPGRGFVMVRNGKEAVAIAGDDFHAAVLRIFIGERPVDKALKAGLLGQR